MQKMTRNGARRRHSDRSIAVVLAVLAIATRLPFRAEFLVNWDAVNFALGVGNFNLATHQPHPPGYLGWVAISRAFTSLTSDPNAAMTLLSAVAGAVATALAFLLARRYASRRASIVVALLFATAPLVWYYSVVALSYMTTGAIALGLLYSLVLALQRRSSRLLIVSGLLLALIGALRPTDQVMLGIAWLVVAWTFSWRTRIRAAVVMGAASLLWIVPLLWLSGGIGAFRGQSSAVAGLAGSRTWIFGGNLAGIGQNLGMVGAGILLGLFGGIVVLALARARGIRPYAELPQDERRLLLAWVSPPLFVYLALHTGQLGYVLLLLPVVYLGVARVLHPLAQEVADVASRASSRLSWSDLRRPAVVVGSLLALNTAAFLVLPPAGLRMLEYSAAATAADEEESTRPPSVDRTRQYDLQANDEHWQALTALIERYDPTVTAILAETSSAGSFRHLSYYAEDHHLYGIGWDRRGDLGYLFHARNRETTYSVARLDDAIDELVLPTQVRTLIVPDAALVERLDPDLDVQQVKLVDDTNVAIIELAEPSLLAFDNPDRDEDELDSGFPSIASSDEEESQILLRSVRAELERDPTPPSAVLRR